MRSQFVATLAGVALAVSCAAAWSQARGNLYLGGGIGQANIKDACVQTPGITFTSCDDTQGAWKAFVGYPFHPNLAAELTYTSFGTTTAGFTGAGFTGDAKVDIDTWDLSAVGSWPLAERFSIFGRLGAYYSSVRNKQRFISGGTSTSPTVAESNSNLTFGAGAGLRLNRNWGLRAEWQRFIAVGGDDTGQTDIDLLSISALYHF
jgi:OOP family OmpA-OmpF porin